MIALALVPWGAGGLCAAEPPPPDEKPEVVKLRAELAALRQELARTKLELGRAAAEVKELKEFLAADSGDEQAKRWREEREKLVEERERLAGERKQLEAARRKAQEDIRHPPPSPPPPPEVKAAQPKYDLDYTLSYIRTGTDRPVYIGFGDLLVPVDQREDIDHRNVMVRGSIQNRSADRWRYTFEVRIAARNGEVVGRWRYQTPVLAANELHPFELKVPVTDAGLIDRYQIGNVEADRPNEGK